MMKHISISPAIKQKVPQTTLGVIYAEVQYKDHYEPLWHAINAEMKKISKLELEQIKQIPAIAATRQAYRKLGKEPARYRPSAEALYRRIVKGKGLYKINNLVDTINLASIKTGYSIGGYDFDRIQGDIVFDLGRGDEIYEAIGRGQINIENLPVFRDQVGAFGSPTTDSVRTMITDQTKRILLIVINFGNDSRFDQEIMAIRNLLMDYASGHCFEIEIIE